MARPVWSLVGQILANTVVGTAALWLACPWRPGRAVSRSSLVELGRFGVNVLGGRLAFFASRRADDFLIGSVLGPVALGLYTAAYRILLVVTEIIIWTIEGVAFPLFSRLYGDRERTARAFYAMTQLCSAVVTPAFLALAVLAPELTRLVLGPRWTGAVPALQVLALVGVPHAVTYLNKAVVDAAGRPDLSLRIAALTAVVNVIGFAVAVRWGMVAVAASYAVCAYLLVPPSVWSVTRVLDVEIKQYLRLFVPPAASALAMLGSIVAVRAALSDAVPGLVLVAALPAGAAAYLVMLSLTDRRLIQDALAHGRRLLAGTDAAWEAQAR